jgi:hypothetical protein
MNATIRTTIARCLSLFCLITVSSAGFAQWTAPTKEELTMTSQPEVPGASAVYLFREEVTDDHLHMWSKYGKRNCGPDDPSGRSDYSVYGQADGEAGGEAARLQGDGEGLHAAGC